MKIKLNPKGTWVTHPDNPTVKFLLRPTSLFSIRRMPSDEKEGLTGEEFFNMLDYSIMDWKGIKDENDKELECNRENKRTVLTIFDTLITFISTEAGKLKENATILDKEVKN